jgi:hypothetical protein
MSFEQNIQEWVKLDTDLNIMNSQSKMIKEKRNNLENEIISYAKENNLDSAVIKLKDSKLKFNNLKVTQPLTLKFIESCLNDIIEDENEISTIMEYIKTQRETKINTTIKRYYNK